MAAQDTFGVPFLLIINGIHSLRYPLKGFLHVLSVLMTLRAVSVNSYFVCSEAADADIEICLPFTICATLGKSITECLNVVWNASQSFVNLYGTQQTWKINLIKKKSTRDQILGIRPFDFCQLEQNGFRQTISVKKKVVKEYFFTALFITPTEALMLESSWPSVTGCKRLWTR